MSVVPIIIRPHLIPFFFQESEGVLKHNKMKTIYNVFSKIFHKISFFLYKGKALGVNY